MPRQTPKRTYSKRGRKATPESRGDGRRQSYLPGVLSTVRRRSAAAMTPSMRQQTLTQIDFVGRGPPSLDDDYLQYEEEEAEEQEEQEEEDQDAPPAKRRKSAAEQSTTPSVRSRPTRQHETDARTPSTTEQDEAPAARPARRRVNKFNSRSAMPPPKTPRVPIKQETPSQSLDERPSSAHSNWSARSSNFSPLKDVSNTSRRVQTRTSAKVQPKPLKTASVIAESQSSTQDQAPQRAPLISMRASNKENQPPDVDEPLIAGLGDNGGDDDVSAEAEIPFILDSEDEGSVSCYGGFQLAPPQTITNEVQKVAASDGLSMLEGTSSTHRHVSGHDGDGSLREENTMLPPSLPSPIKPTTPLRSLSKASCGSRSSRGSRASQPPVSSFVPVLETETQAQAAFQPFSPSMLVRSSQPSPEHPSNPDTQASLPPPNRQPSPARPVPPAAPPTQPSQPPCPTSQAETEVPPGFAPGRRTGTPSPNTAATPPTVHTPRAGAREVVVVDSYSPVRSGQGRPAWDWAALPESQLLPESIMQFVAKLPAGSPASLHSEVLEDDA